MATGIIKEEVDHIDQVLVCQICLNPLVKRKATQLSCLHTFCEECLENILRKHPGREIACAICRQKTELPRGLVTDLPHNFNIEQVQQMAETMAKTLFCSKCCRKKEYIPATLRCITCKWQMCDSCKAKHDILPGFADHHVEAIEHNGSAERTCKIHRSSARLFCRKCKLLLCTQCLIEDTHDTHADDIKKIDDPLTDRKKKALIDDMEYVKKEIEANDKQRQYLSNVEKEIAQAAESMKSHIDKNAKFLINELQENFIGKMEDRSIRLNDALKRGTACLKLTKDSFMDVLERSDSWDQDAPDLKMLITELRNTVVMPMVKFTPRCEVTTIGCLDQTEPLRPDSGRRDMFTQDDLRKFSEPFKLDPLKPRLNKRFTHLPVDLSRDVVPLADGSVLFFGKSNEEILRIDCKGNILSRYKSDGCGQISSMSSFSEKIICICEDKNGFIELALNSENLSLSNSRRYRGIKADGVCVDCNGNIILYDEKTLMKLDSQDNLLWQETVMEKCSRVKYGRFRKRHFYLVNYYFAKNTEIWDEAGYVRGTLKYAPHKHPLAVRDMTVSHRGTFIVTHWCKTCGPGNTVTEYALDGSFIRHLLTQKDGVGYPRRISCDQQGYMWLTNTHHSKRQIDIYKM